MSVNWGKLIIGGVAGYISIVSLRDALGRTDAALKKLEQQCPGNDPKCKIRPAGDKIETRAKYIAEMAWQSSLDPEIKRLAHLTLNKKCSGEWCTPPRDKMAEINALADAVGTPRSEAWREMRALEGHFAWMKENLAYRSDHFAVDSFPSAKRTKQYGGEDCFPTGTLLLRDDYSFVPVEDLRPGMKIWGRDRWSEVQRAWYKGILPVTVIRLNNGSEVTLTEGHHLYVAHCERHISRPASQACSCPLSERKILRVPVSEITEDMVLLAPDSIPFGNEEMDPERAWVEGVYIADGWSVRNSSFEVSGQDGCPKEEQKREVQRICERLGIPTRWHRKYIRVKDGEWTLRMHQMGVKAPQKHALSLGINEAAARELLRGIMADSGAAGGGREGPQGRTLTSTSRTLVLQARVLHRMQGMTCRISYIENHGGLGKHPIWRLANRAQRTDAMKSEKLLRVSEIDREVMSVPCWDVETDDHYIYLPEHDVTVSNCDGHTIFFDALAMVTGFQTGMRIYQTVDASEWNHISAIAEVPPRSGRWMVFDASVDAVMENGKKKKVYPGWQAPAKIVKRYVDFAILPGGGVRKVGSGP